MRASNCAHKYRAGCPARVAPKSVRTVFGQSALLPAPAFRPACENTCARHGELGGSTPSVAVPMLARRWYQCRNPIQKLTCAQPQFNRSLLLLLLRPVSLRRRPRQPVAHLRPASRPYQPLTSKHRTRTISQQPLTPSTILRCDPHARQFYRPLRWTYRFARQK